MKTDEINPETAAVFVGPNLSAKNPPGIDVSMYPQKYEPNIKP